MKKVYLVRHAKSSWADPGLRDIDRPLNKRGFRDAPFMATLIRSKGAKPDLLISSPAKRAFTTATFFASEMGVKPVDIIQKREVYEAMPDDIITIIRQLDNTVEEVFIFGHNPTFTSLANLFAEDYIDNVPTCGIVEITADISDWSLFQSEDAKLKDFHYPKQYIN